MNFFLNYNNGNLTVNTYRAANAQVTTLEDIQAAFAENRDEILVASFEQEFEYHPELKIATFSGVCASSETGFEICVNQEAHNVESEEAGRSIWGLDEDLEPSI